jgi:hypothetical protein
MNTSETGMLDVGHDIRTLQDDEMDLVSGGAGRSFAVDIGTSEQLVLNANGRRLALENTMVSGY